MNAPEVGAGEVGRPRPQERRLLAGLLVIQFVQVMDFTMMLPLGPDLAAPLGLDAAHLPALVAVHTGAAALAGLLGGAWLERAPRRRAMVLLLLGLLGAELLAASAGGGWTMLLARLGAGTCGGQAAALGLVVLSEAVPEARRGRAMGAIMGANALAALAGVPCGLWLAQEVSWRAPFLWMAFSAILAVALGAWTISASPAPTAEPPPTPDAPLDPSPAETPAAKTEDGAPPAQPSRARSPFAPLRRAPVRWALLLTFALVASSFLLHPNLSAFVQHNLGLPREQLPGLYALGGVVALIVVQLVGRAVDAWGSLRVGACAVAVFIAVVLGFVLLEGALPPALGFILLLSSLQSRNVAVRTLSTRVPHPAERGRFMSLMSSAQQLGAATGALTSSALLSVGPHGRLEGMAAVGLLSAATALGTLPLLAHVERGLPPTKTPPRS